jgi:hypothetical protein
MLVVELLTIPEPPAPPGIPGKFPVPPPPPPVLAVPDVAEPDHLHHNLLQLLQYHLFLLIHQDLLLHLLHHLHNSS